MNERYLEDLPRYRALFAPTHAKLDEIEQMPAGPARMAALAALRCGSVDSAAAVRMLALDAADRAWHDAQRMIDLHDLVNGHGHLPGTAEHDRVEIAVAELAPAMRVTTAAANHDIALTLYVADVLPQAWVALSRGQLSLSHVTAIWRSTEHCPTRVAEAVDAAIVPLAVDRRWTPEQIRKHARTIILTIDPDGARDRAQRAKRNDTDVQFHPEPDQMGTVRAHGDAAAARQVYDTINARAAEMGRDPADTRTAGQRRFDALSEFILGGRDQTATNQNPSDQNAGRGVSPAQQRARQRGEVQVRVDLATLLGLNDNPGELDGYGPITADLARELATDATWRRFITDPMTGQLLDLGRSTYTPSAALRRYIEALHPTCQSVGCERPARRCQLDHKREFDRGGSTDRDNLQPLCVFHHQQKTKKRWTLHQHPDGDTWTSALGFTYARNDAPYDVPPLEPLDPDYLEYPPSQASPPDDVIAPYPDEPPPAEPPLDPYETDELTSVLDNGFGEFAQRAYNLLRAAQLIA